MINEKLFNTYVKRLVSNYTCRLADLKIGNLLFRFEISLQNCINYQCKKLHCGHYGNYTEKNFDELLHKNREDREHLFENTYIDCKLNFIAYLLDFEGIIYEDEEGNDVLDGNDFLCWVSDVNNFKIKIPKEYKHIKDIYEDNMDKLREYIFHDLDAFSEQISELRFDSYANVLEIPADGEEAMHIQEELFWKKALNPEHDNDCCICGDQTKYKTRCGHLMCVDCHVKHLQNISGNVDTTCPMCRERYEVIIYDDNN